MGSARVERRDNLGATSTCFVGRKADLKALGERLESGRLVTILGPPGSGKSRLALQFAAEHLGGYTGEGGGGVWACDLAQATTTEDVCTAVGLALGVPLTTGRTSADAVARLGASIAMRGRVLVVLDNAEHVTRGAPETVGTWLRIAPEAQFLVTSRERLGLPGEVLLDVGPLSLPDGDLMASEAVQLFVERARAVRRDFEVGPRDAAVVADLVRHLDGLPLAIELAAARMSVLGPKQLFDRLRLDLLDRTPGPKQSTLRSALDGSWSLLEAHERTTLAQVSVFRGGFSLEAAEAIVDTSSSLDDVAPGPVQIAPGHVRSIVLQGAAQTAPPVLDVLQSLRDKSLLRCEELRDLQGEMRFGMLETIRRYAEERLDQTSRVAQAARERHAVYYLREGPRWASGFDGPDGLDCLRRLSIEAANLIEVHRRALAETPVTAKGATRALEAVIAVEPIFYTRGPARACLSMIDAALSGIDAGSLDPALWAAARGARGRAQRHLGHFADAATDFTEALAIAKREGHAALEGRLLGDLAFLRWREGRIDEARGVYEEALDRLRRAGERRIEGKVLGNLGIVLRESGRLDDAAAAYDGAIGIHEELGNRRSASIIHASRGELLRAQGRLDEARESFERALPIHQEFGDRYSEGAVLADLGSLLQEQGHAAEARTCFERSLECQRAFGNRGFEGLALGLLGDLERETGSLEEARTLYERARHIAHEIKDRKAEGRWLASLATTDAASGRTESATASFATAGELLRGDPFLTTAADIHRGHLDLALARKAERAGDAAGAETLRDAARQRLEAARSGTPAPVTQSAYVRFACRLLESAARAEQPLGANAPQPTWPPSMSSPARSGRAGASDRPSTGALLVASTGRWFQLPGGERVSLQRRHALRLLLKRFIDHRLAAQGEALALDDLLEAGWPGQRVHPQAGASRVYNALTELRKLGLRDVLVSRDDGYLLDGTVPIERVDEAS